MHPFLVDAITAFGFAGLLLAGYYYVIRSPPWWLVTIAVLVLLASAALMIISAVVDFKSGPLTRRLPPTILLPYGSALVLGGLGLTLLARRRHRASVPVPPTAPRD